MSKLAHSNQGTMDQIERQTARDEGWEDDLDAAVLAQRIQAARNFISHQPLDLMSYREIQQGVLSALRGEK